MRVDLPFARIGQTGSPRVLAQTAQFIMIVGETTNDLCKSRRITRCNDAPAVVGPRDVRHLAIGVHGSHKRPP